MPHNLILSTAIGKVALRKQGKEWELTTWERPIGLSWKSMRRTSADRYLSYADGKYEAHILYRDLLARTKAWSMQEYQK